MYLVDMDGVLTNFLDGVCKVYNKRLEDLNLDIDMHLNFAPTPKEFWYWIDLVGEKFWAGLETTVYYDYLMEFLKDKEWYICTSPSRHETSFSGKKLWLKKNFSKMTMRKNVACSESMEESLFKFLV